MKCPACREAMIILELNDVEIDHCLDCQGIWLDKGELELLLGSEDSVPLSRVSKCSEKVRKCPRCGKKMDKVEFSSGNSTILLDSCPKGCGLWFDNGELQDIARNQDTDHPILKLINEMFRI